MSKLLRIYGEKVAIGGGHQPLTPLHVCAGTSQQAYFCSPSGGLFRIGHSNINDYATTASGVRTWLGDGSVDILLGTGNSSAIPNNTHIALEHGVGVHIRGGAWTNNAAGRQEGLHVCTGGKVGIGEDSPISPLTIRKSDGGGTTMGYDSMALLIGGADANNEYTTIGFNWINISNLSLIHI